MRALALLAGVLALAGCMSGPPQPPVVVMDDAEFRPVELDVSAGTVVSFRNDDEVRHTVTFDGGPSLNVPAGSTAQRSFADAGTFPFHCEVHPSMTGAIRVV